MLITKRSPISGQLNSLELDITQAQLDEYNTGKKLVQNIFPNLTRDEREFLISGTTAEDWSNAFGKEK